MTEPGENNPRESQQRLSIENLGRWLGSILGLLSIASVLATAFYFTTLAQGSLYEAQFMLQNSDPAATALTMVVAMAPLSLGVVAMSIAPLSRWSVNGVRASVIATSGSIIFVLRSVGSEWTWLFTPALLFVALYLSLPHEHIFRWIRPIIRFLGLIDLRDKMPAAERRRQDLATARQVSLWGYGAVSLLLLLLLASSLQSTFTGPPSFNIKFEGEASWAQTLWYTQRDGGTWYLVVHDSGRRELLWHSGDPAAVNFCPGPPEGCEPAQPREDPDATPSPSASSPWSTPSPSAG